MFSKSHYINGLFIMLTQAFENMFDHVGLIKSFQFGFNPFLTVLVQSPAGFRSL